MSKRKNITVTITVAKDGSATFSIDKPGPADKQTKAHKYCRMQSAWRGALRQLGADTGHFMLDYPMTPDQQRAYYVNLGTRWGIRTVDRVIIRK